MAVATYRIAPRVTPYSTVLTRTPATTLPNCLAAERAASRPATLPAPPPATPPATPTVIPTVTLATMPSGAVSAVTFSPLSAIAVVNMPTAALPATPTATPPTTPPAVLPATPPATLPTAPSATAHATAYITPPATPYTMSVPDRPSTPNIRLTSRATRRGQEMHAITSVRRRAGLRHCDRLNSARQKSGRRSGSMRATWLRQAEGWKKSQESSCSPPGISLGCSSGVSV